MYKYNLCAKNTLCSKKNTCAQKKLFYAQKKYLRGCTKSFENVSRHSNVGNLVPEKLLAFKVLYEVGMPKAIMVKRCDK